MLVTNIQCVWKEIPLKCLLIAEKNIFQNIISQRLCPELKIYLSGHKLKLEKGLLMYLSPIFNVYVVFVIILKNLILKST